MYKYQNKNVTVVRDARDGDMGYVANKPNQVLVKFEDNTLKVVQRNEATEYSNPVSVRSTEADRPPVQDVKSFLQEIGQELKNAQTANHPTTVNVVTDKINAYVAKL